MSPERLKKNILRQAVGIGIPVLILACSNTDIDSPPCAEDSQTITKTVTFGNDPYGMQDKLKIEKITIERTAAGKINIDQSKQPEGHKLKILSDGGMKFESTNGRTYYISERPGSEKDTTELTITAACDVKKTN